MPLLPTVAVLSHSPALTAVLAATLRRKRRWRVREFATRQALIDYMAVAPIALLVADFDLEDGTAAELAGAIRSGQTMAVSPDLPIIALARRLGPEIRRGCVRFGIDEIVVKPMSPLYLEERVEARLEQGTANYVNAKPAYFGPERRNRVFIPDSRPVPTERRGDNIIAFPRRSVPRSEPAFTPDA